MRLRSLLCLLLLALVAAPAMALSNRVFVRSTGMDVGACPITAPCRSFSYALTQVAPFGEVIALDTAGYGVFTITQSVNVFAAPGVTAFIAVTGGTGIPITAAASDVVVLRGLALSASGGGYGIDFQSGVSLSIENCIINGFSLAGVIMLRSADTSNPRVRIEHSTIRNNSTGVYLLNSGPGSPPPGIAGLTVANSTFSGNSNPGLTALANTRAVVTDTVFSGNNIGVFAFAGADLSASDVNLERCTITQNAVGIQAGLGNVQSLRGVVRIAHNMITGNATGVLENSDGKIMTMTSAGRVTNTIEGNGTNGTFTGSYSAK